MKHTHPSVGIKEIINVNFAILGIEFCWALLLPNVSTIFIFLGAPPSMIPYLWLIPPLIGLILQPIVGQLSDLTVTRYGKRRPYIFVGLIATLMLCILLPFVSSLLLGAMTLWLLIAVVNIAHQPMRTLVADKIPTHQVTLGFAIQVVFIGIGATIGSAMPWILSKWISPATAIPFTFQPTFITIAFFLAGTVALCTGLWTCLKTTERHDPKEAFSKKSLSLFSGLKDVFIHLFDMPKILKQISLAQFLMWVGFFILFAYFNLSIAQTLFGLPPGADVYGNPEYKAIMKRATAYNSFCFIFFQLASFCIALLIPIITRYIHRKTLLTIALAIGGLGLLAILLDPSRYYVIASIAIGIAWGSSLAIHFAMVVSNLSKEKMGLYLGLFNVANAASQIVVGFLLGPIVKYLLDNRVTEVVAYSGLFVILAAICNQFIEDKEK